MGMRTRATPDPDRPGGWVLNGTKCWMSGVREADWYTVFAKTAEPTSRAHDSVTAFIVERSWPGVDVGRTDHKMGVRGVDTGELLLDDVHVPADQRHRRGGRLPPRHARAQLHAPVVAARGIGLAEGALMYATDYVSQRAAFGKTIADFQGVQWEIAKCAVDLEAARLLTYRAAWLADQGKFTKEWVPILSAAKYHATELAVRASGLARAVARGGGLHGGPPDRTVVPRRQAAHDRRRHEPGAAGPRRARGVSTTTCGGTDAAMVSATTDGTSESAFAALGGWPAVLGRLVARRDLTRGRSDAGAGRGARRCGHRRADRLVRHRPAQQGRDRAGDDRPGRGPCWTAPSRCRCPGRGRRRHLRHRR